MNKEQIKKVFEDYIAKSLQADEVWHLRYKPENPQAAETNIEGLELHLSDYTEALAMNDLSGFEEEGASFIKTHFSALHNVSPTDEVYRILLREYVKAQGYCIQVCLKRMKGDYFDEKTCDWMPKHLSEIKDIKTEASDSDTIVPLPGRPSKNWPVILEELYRRHELGELKDKSRATISRDLAAWCNEHNFMEIEPETIRRKLKEKFDELDISTTG